MTTENSNQSSYHVQKQIDLWMSLFLPICNYTSWKKLQNPIREGCGKGKKCQQPTLEKYLNSERLIPVLLCQENFYFLKFENSNFRYIFEYSGVIKFNALLIIVSWEKCYNLEFQDRFGQKMYSVTIGPNMYLPRTKQKINHMSHQSRDFKYWLLPVPNMCVELNPLICF